MRPGLSTDVAPINRFGPKIELYPYVPTPIDHVDGPLISSYFGKVVGHLTGGIELDPFLVLFVNEFAQVLRVGRKRCRVYLKDQENNTEV